MDSLSPIRLQNPLNSLKGYVPQTQRIHLQWEKDAADLLIDHYELSKLVISCHDISSNLDNTNLYELIISIVNNLITNPYQNILETPVRDWDLKSRQINYLLWLALSAYFQLEPSQRVSPPPGNMSQEILPAFWKLNTYYGHFKEPLLQQTNDLIAAKESNNETTVILTENPPKRFNYNFLINSGYDIKTDHDTADHLVDWGLGSSASFLINDEHTIKGKISISAEHILSQGQNSLSLEDLFLGYSYNNNLSTIAGLNSSAQYLQIQSFMLESLPGIEISSSDMFQLLNLNSDLKFALSSGLHLTDDLGFASYFYNLFARLNIKDLLIPTLGFLWFPGSNKIPINNLKGTNTLTEGAISEYFMGIALGLSADIDFGSMILKPAAETLLNLKDISQSGFIGEAALEITEFSGGYQYKYIPSDLLPAFSETNYQQHKLFFDWQINNSFDDLSFPMKTGITFGNKIPLNETFTQGTLFGGINFKINPWHNLDISFDLIDYYDLSFSENILELGLSLSWSLF